MTLRQAREAAELTITGAAIRIKVTEETIKRWERGDMTPNPLNRPIICAAYGIEPDDIEWPGKVTSALEMALSDRTFIKDLVTDFACPEDISGRWHNFCSDGRPAPHMCEKCWAQRERM